MKEETMSGVRMGRACLAGAGLLAVLALSSLAALAQSVPSDLYDGMRWRLVGPFRGGRAEAATGIPGDPLTYYFGAVAGGVWKTTNGGETWMPITDRQQIFAVG